MAPQMGIQVRYACPEGYGPNRAILAEAKMRLGLAHRKLIHGFKTPAEAVKGSNAIYTDVWASMGFEAEAMAREQAFAGYQVNEELHAKAAPGALIMHCLPMQRGKEISETLPEHPCSVLFEQSENRMHVQKALLLGMLPARKDGA
jgi:ornithine carbamoyltransferase